MQKLSLSLYRRLVWSVYDSIVVLCNSFDRYSCSIEFDDNNGYYKITISPGFGEYPMITQSFVTSLQKLLSKSVLITNFVFEIVDDNICLIIDVFRNEKCKTIISL